MCTDSNLSFISQDDITDVNVTETYQGEWKNDKRSGFGISERSDGLRYEGEWYNNKKYGYGVTTHKDGTKEEGKYKNNTLISAGKKSKLFLIRSSKLRERVDNAVTAAQRAGQIAQQKADIALSRMANARAKAEAADNAASVARRDSELARVKAKEYAPEFHQPGTDIQKKRMQELGGSSDLNHTPTRARSLLRQGPETSPTQQPRKPKHNPMNALVSSALDCAIASSSSQIVQNLHKVEPEPARGGTRGPTTPGGPGDPYSYSDRDRMPYPLDERGFSREPPRDGSFDQSYDRGGPYERQNALDRGNTYDRGGSYDRTPSYDRAGSYDRHYDRSGSYDRLGPYDRASSYDRTPSYESNRYNAPPPPRNEREIHKDYYTDRSGDFQSPTRPEPGPGPPLQQQQQQQQPLQKQHQQSLQPQQQQQQQQPNNLKSPMTPYGEEDKRSYDLGVPADRFSKVLNAVTVADHFDQYRTNRNDSGLGYDLESPVKVRSSTLDRSPDSGVSDSGEGDFRYHAARPLQRRKTLPSIMKGVPLTAQTANANAVPTANATTTPPKPVASPVTVMPRPTQMANFSKEAPAAMDSLGLKPDIEPERYIIENGVRKRVKADVYQRPTKPADPLNRPKDLPNRYKVETPSKLSRSPNRGSLPDVSACKELEPGIMPREQVHKLSEARRAELRRLRDEEERRKQQEIVLRLSDLKDWCQQRQLLMLVIALNVSLATMFFNLLSQ